MKLPSIIASFLTLVLTITLAASDPEKLCTHCGVIRPDLVDTGDTCFSVAREEPISVGKGWLIEIDYAYPYHPGCIPESVSCTVSEGGVLKPSQLGVWHISNGMVGLRPITAYFFKAHKPGDATITLVIDGATYSYPVHVF